MTGFGFWYPPQFYPPFDDVAYNPYSFSRYTPYPGDSSSGQSMQLVLQLIREGISGEAQDEMFYDYLIRLAPTEQERQIITGIRNDERKHRRMFRQLYTALTGQQPPVDGQQERFEPPASYLAGIEQALLGELRAFEKYRTIYLNISPEYRDVIFEIMTDELKHAGYYNWLYAKNK